MMSDTVKLVLKLALLVLLVGAMVVIWKVNEQKPQKDPVLTRKQQELAQNDLEYSHHHNLTKEAYTKRMAVLDKQIQADPDNIRLINEKIHISLDIIPEVAQKECLKLLREDPENTYALEHSIIAYVKMKKFKRALQQAVILARIDKSPNGRAMLARVYYDMGNRKSARLHYEKVLQMDPNHEGAMSALIRLDAAEGKAFDRK